MARRRGLGVKVLEIANAPAVATVVAFDLIGEISFARALPICSWSWVLAGVFAALASAQWWLIGTAVDAASRRWRRRRRTGDLRPAP